MPLFPRLRLAVLPLLVGVLVVALVTGLGCGAEASGAPSVASPPAGLSSVEPTGGARVTPERFGWPLQPFNRQHVPQATFGEPRGVLDLDLRPGVSYLDGLLYRIHANQIAAIGRRVIHSGIDIVAHDGTPVYAVASGEAARGGLGYETHVTVGNFQYWHLAEAVPSSVRVVAFRTVIGRVYPGQGHVHLTRAMTRAWVRQWSSAKAARNGGVIRRRIDHVERYASPEEIEREARSRGWHVVVIGDQDVVLSNEGDMTVIC